MKPKLKLEKLRVNSFVTKLGDDAHRVKAGGFDSIGTECIESCAFPCTTEQVSCNTCGDSCNGTCDSCVTCNASCNGTCNTCYTCDPCQTFPCTLPGEFVC